MADFNSKYSGEQVEQLLDMVAGGNAGGGGGGGITVETDPVFVNSPAADITEEQISDWNSAAQTVGGKQDAISDLETIREGATRGATALQYYVTTFDFGDLNRGEDLFQEEVDKANLVAAIRANKLILMPHDKTIPEIGSLVLACYVEDFLYINCIYERTVIHVETDVTNPDIYASEITITTLATQDDIGNAGGGGITVETDPIFLASPAATITEEKIEAWDAKSEQGEKGDKGDKGDTGADGVSVTSVKQTTTSSVDGGSNVITVTLSNGISSTFIVKNGSKGSSGANGANGKNGVNGATFTPSVDSAGNLSWTNNQGLTNPPTVNIKGPKGDKGDAGEGGGGSSGGGSVETISLYGGMGEPLIIDEMLAEKRYSIYIDGDHEGNEQSIVIGGFEGDGVDDGVHIRHFYAVIECVAMIDGVFNVSLSLPDVDIRWSTGIPIPIRGDGHYELSITQVSDSGYAYYHAVLTSFNQL